MTSIAPTQKSNLNDSGVRNVIRELQAKFEGRLVTSLAVREQHGNTVTWVKAEPPDAVVFPHSTQEVSDIVQLCAAHRVPIIPFGTGTSLEGHVNAPLGGICLDLSQMKRVIAVHAEDLDWAENLTVISGELYRQMGEKLDTNRGDQLKQGAFVYLPAMMPHSVWTKGENTVVQVTGTGPFGLDYFNPADDPSKK